MHFWKIERNTQTVQCRTPTRREEITQEVREIQTQIAWSDDWAKKHNKLR